MVNECSNKPIRDELYRLYIGESNTCEDIGKILGVSESTVRRWLIEGHIDLRTRAESKLYGRYRPNAHELKIMYIDCNMSANKISDEISRAPTTIWNWLKEAGIATRTCSEAQNVGSRCPEHDVLERLYVEDGLTCREIASIYNVSDTGVVGWLKNAGIQRRARYPNKSYIYCSLWTEELRESIRDKFGRVCFLCGKTEEENGTKLSVHHTNSGKQCLCDYSCELVPLCKSCHCKTIYSRFKWFSVIMVKIHLESSAQYIDMYPQI